MIFREIQDQHLNITNYHLEMRENFLATGYLNHSLTGMVQLMYSSIPE